MESIKKNFKIFVVFHDELYLEFYNQKLLNHYVFINVNQNNKHIKEYKTIGLNIINLFEIKNFIALGKWYTESEVIYNVYKNKYLYEDLDYVGFTQYDIDTTKLSYDLITQLINNNNHINFQPIPFEDDFSQKILMDANKPNILRGKGKNVYESILEKYSSYYEVDLTVQALKNEKLNLCSSFMLKKELFDEMMDFVSIIIESKELDYFDTERKYRIQGGFLERFYAVWLGLKKTDNYCLPLIHYFEETKNQNKKSIFVKILNKIKSLK
jgi:hypothetical protein